MQRNILIILIIGILLGLTGSFILFQINNKGGITNVVSPNKTATISGTMNINGVIPQNSVLTLLQKQSGSSEDFNSFAQINNPADLMTWEFASGVVNKSYQIKAVLSQNGQTIVDGSPISVTAPATDEKLTLNIPSQTGGTAIISGTIGLNGYIPSGATVTVEGRIKGESNYTVVASNLPAKDNQYMSYTTAVAGQEYEVRGILYDSLGASIGTSNVLTVVAPAEGEALDINSSAKPPVPPSPTPAPTNAPTAVPTTAPAPVVISGNINFNGAALPNSRIVIFQRANGSQNYQVAVDNITPVNGVTWQWNGGQAGQWYNLIAILKQRQANGTDQDISDSNTLTVAAPAANESFTINSGFTLPAPGGPVSVSCGNMNGQTWSATLSFPSAQGAQSYWIEVGTTSGGVQLMNQTFNAATNQNQQISASLQNGVTYFVQYAYAALPNLQAGNSQFSPFSPVSQVRCSQ